MNMDCGIPLTSLQVDGGMTINNLLMQLQADILGISVGMDWFQKPIIFTQVDSCPVNLYPHKTTTNYDFLCK